MLRPLDAHAPYDVGPYRLLAGLGSGGMGAVHLALPEGGGPDDLVALKTVRPDLDLDGAFRVRFRREADAVRAVRSPHVSALVAADPDAERPWLATEYVVGPSLDAAVARTGPLPVDVVRDLGADLARGLAAVHGARLVHRDLKPANVVLDRHGPRLIDFGIAQAYDATALTATGVMVGSPGFMSPEHVAGDHSVTAASDVFCLGALLCYAATGHGPFEDSELAAVVHRIATGRAALDRVPGELAELITACLSHDPAGRPTIREVLHALDPREAAARPGVAPAPRSGPFAWPQGVADLIGAHERAVGRVLAQPAPPRRPPNPGPGPGPVPAPASAPAPVPPPKGPRSRTRWALGLGAGLLVGALTAVLLSLPDGDGGGDDRAKGGGGEARKPASKEPAATGPVLTSATSDFGADGLDRTKMPDGWSPWQARFDGGEPVQCGMGGGTYVCLVAGPVERATGRAPVRLEALDVATGDKKWTYPKSGHLPQNLQDRRPWDIDAGHVYVPAADGFAMVRLRDGALTATLKGKSGYVPTAIRVADGRAYVAYEGAAGTGTATNMLYRAHSLQAGENRRQLWQRTLPQTYPFTLDVVGDRVRIDGVPESVNLDAATGEDRESAKGVCRGWVERGRYAECEGGVRDRNTMERAPSIDPLDLPSVVGLTADGATALTGNASRTAGDSSNPSTSLHAHDTGAGRKKWNVPWDGATPVMIAGDQVVTGAGDLHRYSLADGKEIGSSRGYRGWPVRDDEDGRGAPPLTGILTGGVVFLTFQDGTVLSANVP